MYKEIQITYDTLISDVTEYVTDHWLVYTRVSDIQGWMRMCLLFQSYFILCTVLSLLSCTERRH
jgi:hypothetical protein